MSIHPRSYTRKDSFCLVKAMHITISVFINADKGGLYQDYKL